MKVRLFHPTALALAIVALGFALRLYRLDAQSFWYDEAMSASIARGTVAQILRNDFYSPHPPLYFLALHFWLSIDQSDLTIRLLSAMIGVAGIAGMYCLGKTLYDGTVGVVAATIVALVPYQVFYSQEARMYALLFLLSTLLLSSYARFATLVGRLHRSGGAQPSYALVQRVIAPEPSFSLRHLPHSTPKAMAPIRCQ